MLPERYPLRKHPFFPPQKREREKKEKRKEAKEKRNKREREKITP